jgi:hypothetical protein
VGDSFQISREKPFEIPARRLCSILGGAGNPDGGATTHGYVSNEPGFSLLLPLGRDSDGRLRGDDPLGPEVRFPSRVELRHDRHGFLRGLDQFDYDKKVILLTDQTYSSYRFFGTDAEAASGYNLSAP